MVYFIYLVQNDKLWAAHIEYKLNHIHQSQLWIWTLLPIRILIKNKPLIAFWNPIPNTTALQIFESWIPKGTSSISHKYKHCPAIVQICLLTICTPLLFGNHQLQTKVLHKVNTILGKKEETFNDHSSSLTFCDTLLIL